MGINTHDKLVTLWRAPQTSGDADGYWEALAPNRAWCSITPVLGGGDGRTREHVIEMRYHAQISMDSRLVYADLARGRDRHFLVRGYADLNEAGDLMQLTCEEVDP